MAMPCAWCTSTDTMAGFDMYQCLECGRYTHAAGEKTVATSQANEDITVADVEAEGTP